MSVDSKLDGWQKRKLALFVLIAITMSLIAVCLLLRFNPALNDRISGPPEYLRALTTEMAQQIVIATHGEAPVIVMPDDNYPCSALESTSAPDYDNAYYLLTYSERWHALCITVYVGPIRGSAPADVETLSQNNGKNYGREITSPVRVVPISRSVRRFTDKYLSFLHWRTKLHLPLPPGDTLASRGGTSAKTSPYITTVGVEAGIWSIRRILAERHDRVNFFLLVGLCLLILVLIALNATIWILYRLFSQYCGMYHVDAGFRGFLRQDLSVIVSQAQKDLLQQQQGEKEQIRAQNILRRSREEMEERLRFLLNTVPDGPQRMRVRAYLNDGEADLDAMKELWQELQPQTGQKSPEERLTLLLASLKQYCTDEEFENSCGEAFAKLTQEGFRQARELVVERHDQFRTRAKKLEEMEQEAPPPAKI